MLAALVAGALIIGVLLVRARALIDGPAVELWARGHGLRLTDANLPMVVRYLRTAQVLRTLGVLAGFVLSVAYDLARGPASTAGSLVYIWAFVGYLVGALSAEVTLVRPRPRGASVAVLASRQLGDYLPRRVLLVQRAAGAGAIALALLADAVPYRTDGLPGPTTRAAVVAAGAALAFTAGLEVVQRWVVRRPQPYVTADLVAADDAIRSQSVHSLAGAGIAVLTLVAGLCIIWLSSSDVGALRWSWPLGIFTPLLGFYACMWWGHRPWSVRRRELHGGVPA